MASNQSSGVQALGRSFAAFAADIKLAHSIFALPFAASAFILGHIAVPDLRQIALLLVCMVSARSFAMGMNRYLDRDIDSENPRTRIRKIPSGELQPAQGLAWSLAWGAVFVAAAFSLNRLAGYCSVPLLVILLSYSLMKRFTWLAHFYLGMCLGLAPIAVQIALQGAISLPVLLVGLAVTLWTAGFDILYSLQDMQFDKDKGLHSVPRYFGPRNSLYISRVSFAAMVVLLCIAGRFSGLGALYYFGVAVVGGILTFEHVMVRDARHDGRSAKINAAFFNANAYVSVAFFAFALADVLLLG